MDIFDVLKAISKRKIDLTKIGINEKDALKDAEFYVSNEYHISLYDIRKLYSYRIMTKNAKGIIG